MKHTALTTTLLLTVLCLISSAASASTWYVNGVSGSDSNNCLSATGACKTIGHAISLAVSGDSMMVAAATYKENLTIGFSLKGIGAGASTTIIDGSGSVNTVVTVSNANGHVTLSNVTIRNGTVLSGYGGGISNGGTGRLTINNSTINRNEAVAGGGIYNYGTLTINRSTISGNKASGGGGIWNYAGKLTINTSTLSGNSASAGNGGGIVNGSFAGTTLTINSSTLSGNSANVGRHGGGQGGGIYNNGTTLTINNSTFSGNAGNGGGGGINNRGTLTISNSSFSGNTANYIGGILNQYLTAIQNSIVASNSAGNCAGTMTSNGYNMSNDNTCNFNSTGDLNNTDPKLGTLQNNGGPTQTMSLPSGSPAIDAGNPNGCTDGQGHLLKTDQRGKPRPDTEDTGGCDMGAYESQSD